MKLRLVIFIVLFTSAAVAQQYTMAVIGHSETRTMCDYLWQHPEQLANVTIAGSECMNHDSYGIQTLLQLEPYDLSHLHTCPDFFTIWDGDTDAEHGTDVNTWLNYSKQYIQNIINRCPNSIILFPNVPADSQLAAQRYGGQLYLNNVYAYNQELPGFVSQFNNVYLIDVHTVTGLPTGYGNPNLTYIDFYNLGWQAVMFNFRSAVQKYGHN